MLHWNGIGWHGARPRVRPMQELGELPSQQFRGFVVGDGLNHVSHSTKVVTGRPESLCAEPFSVSAGSFSRRIAQFSPSQPQFSGAAQLSSRASSPLPRALPVSLSLLRISLRASRMLLAL
jgi:hypothetical protein